MAHRGMDVGTSVGLQATAVGVGVAALLYSAHAGGMQRVHEAREARVAAAHQAAVDAALGNAEALARLARQSARDLAAAHAEIRQLKAALAQRQGYIDRTRRAA